MRCCHVHCQKIWHGMQHNSPTKAESACATGIINSPKLISVKNSWRQAIYPTEFGQEGVKNMPLGKRCTQQKLAMLMGVSKTTVHCWIVTSTICVHCNLLKPIFIEENKCTRLEMTLHFVDPEDPTKYQEMWDRVHLDEKWFFLTQEINPEDPIKYQDVRDRVHLDEKRFFLTQENERYLHLPEEKIQHVV